LSWDASSSFTQTAGTITNNGAFDQIRGTFSASGNGTESGNPLQFDGGVTISPSGTGSGSFESRSGNDTLGSDIGTGYTLRVAGRANGHEGNLKVPADRTNRGTIRLGSADDATYATLTVLSGAKLTNAGTIVSEIVDGEAINGNLDNQGTLQINADTGSDSRNPPGTSNWTSSGTINIAADRTLALSWNANSSFTQTAGTITTIGGTFDQTGGTFAASGNGSQTGDPLQFDGDVIISPSGTGSGTFESRSGNATLGSDIGAGYTLRVAGRANGHEGKLIVPADRTNHGTIDLGGENTQGTLAISTGSTLTSNGSVISTFTAANSTNNGPNHVSGRVVNSGKIIVTEASLDGSADVSNGGMVEVGDGTGTSLSLGTLIQSGDIQIADSSQLSVSATTPRRRVSPTSTVPTRNWRPARFLFKEARSAGLARSPPP